MAAALSQEWGTWHVGTGVRFTCAQRFFGPAWQLGGATPEPQVVADPLRSRLLEAHAIECTENSGTAHHGCALPLAPFAAAELASRLRLGTLTSASTSISN